LTRLPDIAQPDAMIARNFNLMVEKYLKATNEELKKEIKEQLLIWIDNHKQLKKLSLNNIQIRELLPLSDDLARISVIGIQAMSSSKSLDEAWKRSAVSTINSAAAPKTECEIKVIEGILNLVSHAD